MAWPLASHIWPGPGVRSRYHFIAGRKPRPSAACRSNFSNFGAAKPFPVVSTFPATRISPDRCLPAQAFVLIVTGRVTSISSAPVSCIFAATTASVRTGESRQWYPGRLSGTECEIGDHPIRWKQRHAEGGWSQSSTYLGEPQSRLRGSCSFGQIFRSDYVFSQNSIQGFVQPDRLRRKLWKPAEHLNELIRRDNVKEFSQS